jgi:RHS repeat-associated protein
MSTTTNYTWNPLTDSVIEESDGSGNSLCTYTNEPTQFGPLVSENRGGTTSYYHADAIGSTRLTTSGSQAIVDSFLFDAWGNTVASNMPTPTPYQWCGRLGYQADALTTAAYVRERVYHAALATWASIDPYHLSRMTHHDVVAGPYLYCLNTPLVEIDPNGLDIRPGTPPMHRDDRVDLLLSATLADLQQQVRATTTVLQNTERSQIQAEADLLRLQAIKNPSGFQLAQIAQLQQIIPLFKDSVDSLAEGLVRLQVTELEVMLTIELRKLRRRMLSNPNYVPTQSDLWIQWLNTNWQR